ncbi:hypothetical protein COLO4_22158 [Corchorus olitorius]|uniref:Uncharacterized protein n=1 Tax=Corchorus olitorius TaxID=93759 RepID=A0A1R3INP9_9ROSI|nr:hypothetical protein COLO4_22158 [Corchorus olitorius]
MVKIKGRTKRREAKCCTRKRQRQFGVHVALPAKGGRGHVVAVVHADIKVFEMQHVSKKGR